MSHLLHGTPFTLLGFPHGLEDSSINLSLQFYAGGLNQTKCCHKGVCTGASHPAAISLACRLTLCFHSECFLQIKKPGAPLADSMYVSCDTPFWDPPSSTSHRRRVPQLPLLQSCALHGHIHGTQVARGTDERRNGTRAELVPCAPAPGLTRLQQLA
jgi:hypothetical protein